MHFRSYFDNEYLGAWDIPAGRDVVVTIARVEGKKLKSERGESSKAILFFEGKQKGMVCNVTNARTIAGLYGKDVVNWVGKRIALYATTTQVGGEVKECIRIRQQAPRGGKAATQPAEEPAPPANGAVEKCETGTCGACAMCEAAKAQELS